VRASERHHSVNIIMVTGSTSIDVSRPADLDEGVVMLSKPVDFHRLKNMIFSSKD
jgi:FixJ family two-component response regulator